MKDPAMSRMDSLDRRQFLPLAALLLAAPWARAARGSSIVQLPAPDLRDDAVLRRVAGLRPYRDLGIRLESEEIAGKVVVHDYGHGGGGVTLSFGSAEAVSDIVAGVAATGTAIAVLGAGAIGLTAALELLRRGYRVRVLAKDFPPNTTSNLAGAEWLPFGVGPPAGSDGRARFERIVRASFEAFRLRLGDDWGVHLRSHYEVADPVRMLKDVPPDLITARPVERMPFPGVSRSGFVFDTFLIEPPVFLPRLMAEVLRAGAILERRELRAIEDVRDLSEPVIVNATGLGAGVLCGDSAIVPVRGQLVHLFPQRLPYTLTHEGGYMFPRHDAVVLGGTFERGITDSTPDPVACTAILERHRKFFAGSEEAAK